MTRLEAALADYEEASRRYGDGDFAAAAEAFGAVAERYGDDPPDGRCDIPLDALLYRARALEEVGGRTEEAIAALDAMAVRWGHAEETSSRASLVAGLVLKGYMLEADGRDEAALAAYGEAIERFGGSEDPFVVDQVGYALRSTGDLLGRVDRAVEAVAAFDRALAATAPGDDEEVRAARASRGILLQGLGRHAEALTDLDAVCHAPDVSGGVLYQRSLALVGLGRREEAVIACDEALRVLADRDDQESRVAAAQILYNKGYQEDELGRTDEALATWATLIAEFSEVAGSDARRGVVATIQVLYDGGRHEEAVAAADVLLAQTVRTDGDAEQRAETAQALRCRARSLARLGRVDEAVEAYRDVLVRFGVDVDPAPRRRALDATVELAAVLNEQGEYAEALVAAAAFLEQAVAAPDGVVLPTLVTGLLVRAIALHQSERWDEAIEAYEEVVAAAAGETDLYVRSRAVVALMNETEALAMAGRDDEAEAAAERLAELEPDAAEVFAVVARELGDRDDPFARIHRVVLGLKEAMVLRIQGREEAPAVLRGLLERHGDDELPDVRRMLDLARMQLDELDDEG